MEIRDLVSKFIYELEENSVEIFPAVANKTKSFDSQKDTVFYSGPYWDRDEIVSAVSSLLEGKWLSSGEQVNKFERGFSKKFNINYSVMVNSGSSANLVMIAALKEVLGWKNEDEVIVSVVGFPTTANSIIQNGLMPKFVDISWDDLNWDLQELSKALTPRTKAIFCSPVLGNPGNFGKIIDFCKDNSIELILDNCDSLGTKWRGKYLNEYAIASSCSFYPAHHITTMEGGMVSSNTEEIIKVARSFAWWGRGCYCVGRQNLLPDGTCKKRFSNWIPNCTVQVDHKYVFERIGYNLKPLDLQGAIGLTQLQKFPTIHELRVKNKSRMDKIINSIPGCKTIDAHPDSEVSWFGAPIICETPEIKQELVHFFESNRIQTRNYFAGNLLMQPGYSELGNWKDYPRATEVLSKVFFLGVSPTISTQMLDYIEDLVNNFNVRKDL